MRIAMYSLGLLATKKRGTSFVVSARSPVTLRPKRLLADVKSADVAALTSLVIGGAEQLIVPANMNLYVYSFKLARVLDEEFSRENGLVGKSDEEIQEWLDARDLEMPSAGVGRIDLPTIVDGTEVVLRGGFGRDVPANFSVPISIIGMARIPE